MRRQGILGFNEWSRAGGKLKAAAEHWAGGGDESGDQSKLVEDAAALGVILISNEKEEKKNKHFEVWDENWPTVEMFLRLDWRFTMGERTGLNYQTLEWLCRVFQVENVPEMYDGLRTMELSALTTIAQRRKADGK